MSKLCRACLSSSFEIKLFYVKDEEAGAAYANMLYECTGIALTEDELLEQGLCCSCCDRLKAAWSFINMCKSSQNTYQKASDLDILIKEESVGVECDNSIKSEDGEDDEEEDRIVVRGNLKELQCPKCKFVARKNLQMKKHLRQQHDTIVGVDFNLELLCEFCNKTFERKSGLKVHLRIHTGEKPFRCDQCPKSFAQSGTLIEHKRHHLGGIQFKCKTCGRGFSSKTSFRRHCKSHTAERRYACEECGKTFLQNATLKNHRAVHSDARPFQCDLCPVTAKTRVVLSLHMLTHAEKRFQCDKCGKKFGVKRNLKIHISNMHSLTAGVCPECNKETSDLTRHMLIHSDVPFYKCHKCDRAFRIKASLSQHLNSHYTDKYKCEFKGCSETFANRRNLGYHERKFHFNDIAFPCQHCDKGYFRGSDLSRHMNTFHSSRR